ncbi:unnamed protein product, partial [Musa acuminata subsp. burmannicoides]
MQGKGYHVTYFRCYILLCDKAIILAWSVAEHNYLNHVMSCHVIPDLTFTIFLCFDDCTDR